MVPNPKIGDVVESTEEEVLVEFSDFDEEGWQQGGCFWSDLDHLSVTIRLLALIVRVSSASGPRGKIFEKDGHEKIFDMENERNVTHGTRLSIRRRTFYHYELLLLNLRLPRYSASVSCICCGSWAKFMGARKRSWSANAKQRRGGGSYEVAIKAR